MSFEIGKDLETGEPTVLNVKDIVAGRTYIASMTRFGKSHTARRIVEEILENWVGQVGIIIIDPEGEYASLREKYPVLIIGRDVPIQVETPTLLASTAAFMAEKVLEAGASVILDISLIEPEAGKDYVDKFLRHFFHLQTTAKKPYLVLEEEAEDFAPESGAPGSRTCLEISITLGKRGGKRGIGVIYVGHRPAWINKGILSQCPNKALGRIEQPDMTALENVARIPHAIVERLVPKTDEKGDVVEPGPEKGVFYFTGGWVKKSSFVKVGPVKTTHLGATPEIIPRPIGEVKNVIENVTKALTQLIEKTKPVVISQSEIESKIRNELENRYKSRIETLERTAVERAERKYKVKIDELQQQVEKLSRSQTLQPTGPISNVLEHPIVRARMLQLDEKSRDLLTFIEKEPNHTREELAARMISSKDAIAAMVEKINRVFQVEAIVAINKRPIRYRSMLQRLFLTDVGRKEIEELEKVQNHAKALETELTTLRPIAQQSTSLRTEVQRLTTENGKLSEDLKKTKLILSETCRVQEILEKENAAFTKIKEGFTALIPTIPAIQVDDTKIMATVEKKAAEILDKLTSNISVTATVEEKIQEMVDAAVNNKMQGTQSGDIRMATIQQTIIKTDVEPVIKQADNFKDDTDKGKIMMLAKEGYFKSWHSVTEIINEMLEKHRWTVDRSNAAKCLTELVQDDYLVMKKAANGVAVYALAENVRFLGEKNG